MSTPKNRLKTSVARSIKSLTHDTVDFTLDMVELGHGPIGRVFLKAFGVTDTIRAVNRDVSRAIDVGLDVVDSRAADAPHDATYLPMRSDITRTRAWLVDAAVASLNGAVGDYLHASGNALDVGFLLRSHDGAVDRDALRDARAVVIFVHGLGTSEWSWCLESARFLGDSRASFGTKLEGAVPLYARYNTGRAIADNGALLAERIAELGPLRRIVLVGHSMGGLVVRSACEHARRNDHEWLARVTDVISLGSPHGGAPLEKLARIATKILKAAGHPGATIPGHVLGKRSRGVRDLAEGRVVDEGNAPLLDHVRYTFVASSFTKERTSIVARVFGDGMVRHGSAHASMSSGSQITTHTLDGIAHMHLTVHPDVFAIVESVLKQD